MKTAVQWEPPIGHLATAIHEANECVGQAMRTEDPAYEVSFLTAAAILLDRAQKEIGAALREAVCRRDNVNPDEH